MCGPRDLTFVIASLVLSFVIGHLSCRGIADYAGTLGRPRSGLTCVRLSKYDCQGATPIDHICRSNFGHGKDPPCHRSRGGNHAVSGTEDMAMKRISLVVALLLALTGVCLAQSGKPLLMRDPTLSKTHIVFVYAGDLWLASREGGEASRLTTGVGNETSPRFSPDGKLVAFTGEYDGNVDVYTIPSTGGVPRRLTYHPGADYVAGWTPDGKRVLFVSQRTSESGRFARLFTMPVDGVFPAEVPLPMGYEGSYSPDAGKLAYAPL